MNYKCEFLNLYDLYFGKCIVIVSFGYNRSIMKIIYNITYNENP